METLRKTMVVLTVLLITVILASCATTGQYMPLANNETVIGTVQTTFMVRNNPTNSASDAVNTQAYIRLMEVAEQNYSGGIDLRDIEWARTGRLSPDNHYVEFTATGKVIQIN